MSSQQAAGAMPDSDSASVKNLFIIGVTRMRHGVCVGAIDTATGAWVRPVRRHGELGIDDLRRDDGGRFTPGDVVRLRFDGPRPDPPHSEDWVWDPAAHPAQLVERPDEAAQEALLACYAEPDPLAILDSCERSMCLVRVDTIEATFGLHAYSGNFEARIVSSGLTGESGFPCVDLRWRALGRMLTRRSGLPAGFTDDELRQRLDYRYVYLALGKGRLFQEQHWPLVGAVRPVPDYTIEVDYDDL